MKLTEVLTLEAMTTLRMCIYSRIDFLHLIYRNTMPKRLAAELNALRTLCVEIGEDFDYYRN